MTFSQVYLSRYETSNPCFSFSPPALHLDSSTLSLTDLRNRLLTLHSQLKEASSVNHLLAPYCSLSPPRPCFRLTSCYPPLEHKFLREGPTYSAPLHLHQCCCNTGCKIMEDSKRGGHFNFTFLENLPPLQRGETFFTKFSQVMKS